MDALGIHLLLELNECDHVLLNDLPAIRDIMLDAARTAGATVLGESFHHFSPQGVSGILVIAESHLSVHTWPEHGYAGADIFTCGTTVLPEKAVDVLVERFAPKTHSLVQVFRGMVAVKEKVTG
ncbi:MAG: adenosylmethionine decarboxylase [Dehalococcoidia bacterium]|nr:adenosylmethionine decarboxylase [Dehalococcoidia bacterium]